MARGDGKLNLYQAFLFCILQDLGLRITDGDLEKTSFQIDGQQILRSVRLNLGADVVFPDQVLRSGLQCRKFFRSGSRELYFSNREVHAGGAEIDGVDRSGIVLTVAGIVRPSRQIALHQQRLQNIRDLIAKSTPDRNFALKKRKVFVDFCPQLIIREPDEVFETSGHEFIGICELQLELRSGRRIREAV